MGTIDLAKSINTESFNNRGVEQHYKYLFVLDFEATCWSATDPNYKLPHEIIEFSVVLYDVEKNSVVAEFQQYVRPTEHPLLSPFCTELTGITQNQVTEEVDIKECLNIFAKWFAEVCQTYNIVVVSEPALETNDKRGVFVTWSNWDLSVCLPRECTRKRLSMPAIFRRNVDLRALYINHYSKLPHGLQGALAQLEMKFVGREHSGISDARNTAYLAARMMRDGCVIR